MTAVGIVGGAEGTPGKGVKEVGRGAMEGEGERGHGIGFMKAGGVMERADVRLRGRESSIGLRRFLIISRLVHR